MEGSIKEVSIMVPFTSVARFKWDKSLGERLQAHRKSKKMARQRLADEVAAQLISIDPNGRFTSDGCSLGYVQKLEEGSLNTISADIVQAIAIVLDIEIDYLLFIDITINSVFKKVSLPS